MNSGFAPQCSIEFTEDINVIGGTAIKSPFFQFKTLPIKKRETEPFETTVENLLLNFFLDPFQIFQLKVLELKNLILKHLKHC